MADRDIVTRAGKGSALSATDYDQNLNGLHGSVDSKTSSTYTVLYTDQGKTIQLNHSTMVCTLDELATITAAIDTDSFLVRLKNLNAAACTINTADAAQIDGNNSIQLTQYESVVLQINNAGTGWNVVANSNKLRTLTLDTLGATADIILDDDSMAADDASALVTQQSIKAYSDAIGARAAAAAGRVNGTTGSVNGFGLTCVRDSTGTYTLTLDTPSSGVLYTVIATVDEVAIKHIGANITGVSTFEVKTRDWNGSNWDIEDNNFWVAVFNT